MELPQIKDQLDNGKFKLPVCPSCNKEGLLLDRLKERPFLEWTCRECQHVEPYEYGKK
jgi:RNase P subunit RPR2|tara:strand:+ start:1049 stop:1222 length:174 start_codon:yes stop_codon:yes gene_type:complete